MMEQEKDKNIQEELQAMGSSLGSLKQGTPFQVPTDYFQSLPDDLMRRIRAEASLWPTEAPQAAATSRAFLLLNWLQHWKYQLGILGVLAAATIYYFLLPGAVATAATDELAQLEAAEIKQYVSNNIDEFSMELLLEAAIVESEDVHSFDVLEGLDENTLDQLMDDLLEDIDLNDLNEIF
ncbi:MAG TPA: hypothetical protein PKA00_17710 [Saprospiraceae bacterium]|nr:hypothetical protein [Saprospiraceae bacterium]HMQ84759.1 hypothetical protein [Saprospiraceae bacterium]